MQPKENEIRFTDSPVFQKDFVAAAGQEDGLVAIVFGALVLDVAAECSSGDPPLLLHLGGKRENMKHTD